MANEFQHKDPGSALTQAEYITTDGTGHIFDCQATGDIMYASSATVLKNLGKGAANTVLSMGGSCIPAWTASPSVTDLTIGGGCITLSAATDIDLLDNNASALSFDATGKTGIIDIVTTDCSEGVTMSGTLGVTGILTANAGVVVDNFTLDGTELDLSTGDFALDVAGDVEINADGGCVNFKDASLALAAIVNTSCVGELRLHEAANYIGLKPPALSANQTWTWPATKGSCGEVLTCDGCGVLSWASASAAVTAVANGSDNRVSTFSSSTALNGEANLTFDGTLLKVGTTAKACHGIQLEVNGTLNTSTCIGHISIQSTDDVAVDKGGHLTLGGVYHDNGARTTFGGIAAYKSCASSNTYNGYLSLYARATGAGTVEYGRFSHCGALSLKCGSLTPATGYTSCGDGPTVVGKGLIKVWGSSTSGGGLQTGAHNVTSVAKCCTGIYDVTIATDFPAGAYKAQATARICSAAFATTDSYAAGTFKVYTRCQAGNAADKVFNFMMTGVS